jgi:trimethylamine--corrinoid protein Co-methyltransferase
MLLADERVEVSEPKRPRSGRGARREARSHGSQGLGRPYIIRNIPTYDILSEDNLVRIEQTADRILAEIGIEFRDDPVALDHWRGPARRLTACWSSLSRACCARC